MSDREAILRVLRQADARIRACRAFERVGLALTVWTAPALLVKLADLAWPMAPSTLRLFWIVWIAGSIIAVIQALRLPPNLSSAAREIDRKSRLEDEFLSAWWFASGTDTGPGVALHLGRAAEHTRTLDLMKLFPRRVPGKSLLGLVSLAALMALHLAPLSLPSGWALSQPPPDVPEREQALIAEIENLLAEAEALAPDGSLERFQNLMEADPEEVGASTLLSDLDDLQSSLEEGNLTNAGMLEGLEDMAEDLRSAPETRDAAEALTRGDLTQAASELEALGSELAGGAPSSDALAQALRRAGMEQGAGLDALTTDLSEAAGALEAGDGEGAGEGLQSAADSLRDLADLARGQELRNLAAEGIEALETALSQQAAESPPGTGEPGANSSASPGASPGGEGSPGEGAPGASGDPGEGESGAEPGEAGPGQGGAGDQAPGQGGEGVPGLAGSPEAMAGGDSGLTPAGLGLSPAVKTGLETFLEVQLERVVTQARSTESSSRSGSQTDGRLEVTTSQERSGLDYRSVPSELSPAEQALLEQDRIPPRYRNMIREYFQIIREPMP